MFCQRREELLLQLPWDVYDQTWIVLFKDFKRKSGVILPLLHLIIFRLQETSVVHVYIILTANWDVRVKWNERNEIVKPLSEICLPSQAQPCSWNRTEAAKPRQGSTNYIYIKYSHPPLQNVRPEPKRREIVSIAQYSNAGPSSYRHLWYI